MIKQHSRAIRASTLVKAFAIANRDNCNCNSFQFHRLYIHEIRSNFILTATSAISPRFFFFLTSFFFLREYSVRFRSCYFSPFSAHIFFGKISWQPPLPTSINKQFSLSHTQGDYVCVNELRFWKQNEPKSSAQLLKCKLDQFCTMYKIKTYE